MNTTSRSEKAAPSEPPMKREYKFDYSAAKPNRFAERARKNSVAVLLEPDVAEVFKDAGAVNAVLRALIQTMPLKSS